MSLLSAATMDLVTGWIKNDNDKRSPNEIIKTITLGGDMYMLYILCLMILKQPKDNNLGHAKAFDLMRLLIASGHVDCSYELLRQRNTSDYNPITNATLRKYSPLIDARYFSTSVPRGHLISKI